MINNPNELKENNGVVMGTQKESYKQLLDYINVNYKLF